MWYTIGNKISSYTLMRSRWLCDKKSTMFTVFINGGIDNSKVFEHSGVAMFNCIVCRECARNRTMFCFNLKVNCMAASVYAPCM